MATATFYLLDEIGDANLLPFICQQVYQQFRQGARVLVVAADQQQAEALDELLWQLPTDAFVPHNLSGEGGHGSPVELSWPGQSPRGSRPCVVNLAAQAPDMAARAQQVIDIVPVADDLRAQARERFKQYRQHGIALTTEQAVLANDS
ncbi:MAG: DNA polymerase III subunit chi [Idiomarina sp.]|nr:DNA polymerase III subunit chi [Idiomarina sp.]